MDQGSLACTLEAIVKHIRCEICQIGHRNGDTREISVKPRQSFFVDEGSDEGDGSNTKRRNNTDLVREPNATARRRVNWITNDGQEDQRRRSVEIVEKITMQRLRQLQFTNNLGQLGAA